VPNYAELLIISLPNPCLPTGYRFSVVLPTQHNFGSCSSLHLPLSNKEDNMKRESCPEVVPSTFIVGPLDRHLPVFVHRITQQGYCATSLKPKIVVMNRFNRWLASRNLALVDLDEQSVIDFFKETPRPGHVRRGDHAGLLMLLDYLRQVGVTSSPPTEFRTSAWHSAAEDFARYLRKERRLSEASVLTYVRIAELFLSKTVNKQSETECDLSCQKITEFICKAARCVSPRYAQLMTCALRSLLRFLYIDGKISNDLSLCVPSVAEWKLSTLPKFLEPAQVEALLAAIVPEAEIQKRDHAILLLLARLGLRACEIAKMELDDIHWDLGQLTVRGKGGKQSRLPIAQDVGAALAEYLLNGRPRCATRRVFIRAKAPRQGFAGSVAVCDTVRRALSRAGLNPPRKGAHLLRHSLAVRMLRSGANLNEIAEVLCHCSPTTTEIYTKVDLNMLAPLAQPWPGGEA
jgi:site-specific recombinase XerD